MIESNMENYIKGGFNLIDFGKLQVQSEKAHAGCSPSLDMG